MAERMGWQMNWSKRLSRYTLPGMGLKWDASYFGLLFLAMLLIVLYTFLREYQTALRAFANYRSFFTETKSIYLMKRLKDKNELSRRCLAIPAAARGAALILFLLLLWLFVLIYRNGVPARCMPPEETLNIWGAFF